MPRREPRTDLTKLRNWRVRPDRDASIVGAVRDAAAAVDRQHRASRGGGEAWDSIVPPRIRQRCGDVQIHRGVLTVKVRDAATRFEIDRWLRSGGEAELSRRAGIRRIKIVLGPS
jgi:hypothetical protein